MIETKRLILRPLIPSDAEELGKLFKDPEVMRFSVGGVRTQTQTQSWVKKNIHAQARDGFSSWAVIEKQLDQLIGFCGITLQEVDGALCPEIGYRFARDVWGKGYATEAAIACRNYGFETLGMDRLVSVIEAENKASIAVAHKTGLCFLHETQFHGIPVRIYEVRRLTIEAYSTDWPKHFEEEKRVLEGFFSIPIEFHHIGSTAIIGCAAKPIIDIMGVTPHIELVDEIDLSSLGYEALGEFGMPRRRYFQKRQGQAVNLHIFETINPEVKRHTLFMRMLNQYPEKALEYTKLKKELAGRYPGDIYAYCLGKSDFIHRLDQPGT